MSTAAWWRPSGSTLPGAAWQRCRTHWACKESTCRRVVVVPARIRQGGEELGCGGEPGAGQGGDVAVPVQQRTDLAQHASDGATADFRTARRGCRGCPGRARVLVRDYDGAVRAVERRGPTKAAAE